MMILLRLSDNECIKYFKRPKVNECGDWIELLRDKVREMNYKMLQNHFNLLMTD